MRIKVKVKAGSRKNLVEKRNGDEFFVWTVAEAREGKANKAVGELIAKFLGKRKSEVVLEKGEKSSEKVFLVKD